MARISRYGGPSDVSAQPGDVATNAEGLISALHPDEQGALPLYGEGDESEWLGTNSQASTEKQTSTTGTSENDDRGPARTTGSRFKRDSKESSSARMTGGDTKESGDSK
jgi:hypothetical protein